MYWCAALAAYVLLVRLYFDDRVHVRDKPLTWLDWTGLASIVLTVAGVGAAVVQASRARSAASAASEAVDRTLDALARADLLVELQALRQVEHDIDRRVGATDWEGTGGLLRTWRDTGARVCTALAQADSTDALIELIEGSRLTASLTTVKLTSAQGGGDLIALTKKFRTEVALVGNHLSTRLSELRIDPGGTDV